MATISVAAGLVLDHDRLTPFFLGQPVRQ